MTSNLAATSAHGDISDPGPASSSRKGSADIIIDLQTILSLFNDDPHFYNPASLLITCCLLGAILFTTLRSETIFPNAWFAVAAISAITMLPSYHRPYDARLLLLAVPAAAMLWARESRFSKAVAIVAALAIVLTADIPIAILSLATGHLDVAAMGLGQRILALPIIRPAPLVLSLLALLLTIVYTRQARAQSSLRSTAAPEPLVGR